ncbi:hypothetical protein [Marinitoga arctica]
MKKYKDILIIILNKKLKTTSIITLKEKEKYIDYNYYMLKIGKDIFYPIPFEPHKIETFNGYAICNREKTSTFKYEGAEYRISSNQSKNNKSVFYSGVENEILVNLKIKKILKSDNYLTCFLCINER